MHPGGQRNGVSYWEESGAQRPGSKELHVSSTLRGHVFLLIEADLCRYMGGGGGGGGRAFKSVQSPVADPGFGKGGFMRMYTVATMPPFDAHAHRWAAAVLTASTCNCRETVLLTTLVRRGFQWKPWKPLWIRPLEPWQIHID